MVHVCRSGIIVDLIACCGDTDASTRKFACFAVGNAGFHNDRLYSDLRQAIPHLVTNLSDADEKTRANAAGALGNLVRNSGLLCPDIVSHGAIQALMKVLSDNSAGNTSAKKITLFSFGNICAYEECRLLMNRSGFQDILHSFDDSPDPVVQKYVTRIRQKME
eukprot:TRINITY_DN4637_c0_g1_i11.p2 TRINITY_DN4637_c0_g1~~TRINITY_DN4637_c0_g1_i11.p2  ORF type:complete len:163 (+),score=30.41 TRINITY_DN4637_c0_g1_i11:63-551(+)